MKSYKQKFLDNLDVEIAEFREKALLQSPKEIYDDANRICFYEFMNDYLRFVNYKASEYKMFLQSDTDFIHNLRRESLKWENFNTSDITDAYCLVDAYITDCTAHPIPDCM